MYVCIFEEESGCFSGLIRGFEGFERINGEEKETKEGIKKKYKETSLGIEFNEFGRPR